MTDAFHLRNGHPGQVDEQWVSLGGRYGDMPIAFFDAIEVRARARIERLTRGEVYNAEHLLGVEYWMTLDTDARKCAGKALAYLVGLGHLPLQRYRIRGKRSAYYRVL